MKAGCWGLLETGGIPEIALRVAPNWGFVDKVDGDDKNWHSPRQLLPPTAKEENKFGLVLYWT
jgi:hypothetical protein